MFVKNFEYKNPQSNEIRKHSKVVMGGVPQEKIFLEISQNSQENTGTRASFLIKLQAEACNLIKKETLLYHRCVFL